MRIRNEALYFTDNGAVYCGDHLGVSAKTTGRDISGQEISIITPEDVAELARDGITWGCEQPGCPRTPRLIHVP